MIKPPTWCSQCCYKQVCLEVWPVLKYLVSVVRAGSIRRSSKKFDPFD